MDECKRQFFELAINSGALLFGEFKLKSGRTSPYFFNSGSIDTGGGFGHLCRAYATRIDAAIKNGEIGEVDVVFGPAYKGIPLVAGVAMYLEQEFCRNIPFAYNRKEVKNHGEGNLFVGRNLNSIDTTPLRVLIVDDVITAGTAVKDSLEIIKENSNAIVVGVVVAFDREEIVDLDEINKRSAIQMVAETYNISIVSIAGFTDLVQFLVQENSKALKPADDTASIKVIQTDGIQKMLDYRRLYGNEEK